MDAAWSLELRTFAEEVRRFTRENLLPETRQRVFDGMPLSSQDHMGWQDSLARKGWLAGFWPREHGGCAWSAAESYIFQNETSAAGIGYLRAKEYLLTGDPIPAPEAARMGLINRAVPLEALDDEVYGLARRLTGGARKAIRWTKVATNLGLKQLAHMIMDTGIAYETLSNISKDHQEAVRAFRERRKPVFTGE